MVLLTFYTAGFLPDMLVRKKKILQMVNSLQLIITNQILTSEH